MIEHSSNYSDTTVSLRFYSNNEPNNFGADIANTNAFNSFEYKAKLLENTVANGNNSIPKNGTIVVPLKYLSDFWRSLEMSLINCKIALKFRWRKHCVLASADIEKDDTNNIILIIILIILILLLILRILIILISFLKAENHMSL